MVHAVHQRRTPRHWRHGTWSRRFRVRFLFGFRIETWRNAYAIKQEGRDGGRNVGVWFTPPDPCLRPPDLAVEHGEKHARNQFRIDLPHLTCLPGSIQDDSQVVPGSREAIDES